MLPVEINVAPRALSPSLFLFALFLRRLSNGVAFLSLLHRLSLEHWWLSKRKLNEQPCQRDSISSNDAVIMLFPSEIALPETDGKDGGDNRWFSFFFFFFLFFLGDWKRFVPRKQF